MDSLSQILLPVTFVGIGLAIVIAILVAVRRRLGVSAYRRRPELFSIAEVRLLRALEDALRPKYRVFGKVRVADLIDVKPGLQQRTRQAALNRIAYKHFDFVICDSATLDPLCAVELNDRSHLSKRTKRRDDMVSKISKDVGLPLVLVQAAASYETRELQSRISHAIHQPGKAAHGA